MLELNIAGIKDPQPWRESQITLPQFDVAQMRKTTRQNPAWVHFGAGNIFRGFIAALQQKLLNSGKVQTGIVAAEMFDVEVIDNIYQPYDNLTLLALMHPDGTLDKEVIASIAEGCVADCSRELAWQRLQQIFTQPGLQMVSFTITEKGYAIHTLSGELPTEVRQDMQLGPEKPHHPMAKIASLLYTRYRSGKLPLALVSMDNCSHNGEKLHDAVEAIAREWVAGGLVEADFIGYLNDPKRIAFPWSMIDKITPRPSEGVKKQLTSLGLMSTEILCTAKNTYIAPFVNAEKPQYLVVEDTFPNGRMPLENAGVIFTDRVTVERAEKMKVCTCLNPLHTALAVFGCLLGYTLIADEIQNPLLKKLIEQIGYTEGLPVVVDPGIIDPQQFIREVIEERLPNPYIPDTPQRIASDTSQKVGIRFGETIKAYRDHSELDPAKLTFIPLAIAGWCRYLLGVDDQGSPMALSPDPLLKALQEYLATVQFGVPETFTDQLQPILSNQNIFGVNLYEVGLGEKIEAMFRAMIAGPSAVKGLLQKSVK